MKKIIFLTIYTAIYISAVAQCPDKICSDTYTEWGFSMIITNPAYIPEITNTDENCYITLQSEIPELDFIFAKYKIVNFYKYLDTIQSNAYFIIDNDTLYVKNAYILVCDSGQYELGEELSNFPDAIPYIEQRECFIMCTGCDDDGINEIISNKNTFWQKGNYLIFSENTNRTINFYSVIGVKIFSIQSSENKINPSLYLQQKGICIVEIIENGKKYSGYYNNLINTQ